MSETNSNSENVDASGGKTEVLELSETSKAAQEKHAELLRRVEAERRARSIVVPTTLVEIVHGLRQLGHPITLFGEKPVDRRERLRILLSQQELEGEEQNRVSNVLSGAEMHFNKKKVASGGAIAKSQTHSEKQLFYIPVKSNRFKNARSCIFAYSINQAEFRLKRQKREKLLSMEEERDIFDRHAKDLYNNTKHLALIGSQMGDGRPISCALYSPNSEYIASGSWSSLVKLWRTDSLEDEVIVFRGHDDRITGLAWHPQFSKESKSNVALCSGSADNTAKLWTVSSPNAAQTFSGHKSRLGNIAFHPTGKFVGTTSFDHTWRLWDVESGDELLLQEGHYSEVYAISFHPDGALVSTGDLNGNGRLWDLRSGKSIMSLQGHSKQILSMDFSCNGYNVASGSNDHSVRIWDIRSRKCGYVIPAHAGLVSEVHFSPVSGELLLSSSYDSSVRIWRTRDWKKVKTLKGHEGKIMSAKFSSDEKHIVTAGFDRTFKIWAHENEF